MGELYFTYIFSIGKIENILKGPNLRVLDRRLNHRKFRIWTNLYTDRMRKLKGIQYNTEIQRIYMFLRYETGPGTY